MKYIITLKHRFEHEKSAFSHHCKKWKQLWVAATSIFPMQVFELEFWCRRQNVGLQKKFFRIKVISGFPTKVYSKNIFNKFCNNTWIWPRFDRSWKRLGSQSIMEQYLHWLAESNTQCEKTHFVWIIWWWNAIKGEQKNHLAAWQIWVRVRAGRWNRGKTKIHSHNKGAVWHRPSFSA